MDHERFDTLARRVFTDLRQSRRTAVATLLGATLLRHDPSAVRAKTKARANATTADDCYPGGTTCRPGRGKNTSGCDFTSSTIFRNADARGSNLSKSNFSDAVQTGADLRGANLGGSCLRGADLTGAKLGGANLRGAIICNTTMPDGSNDISGCDKGTACCPTLLQDCPDATVDCLNANCEPIGTIGPMGHCFGERGCCPCGSDSVVHWQDECNKAFPAKCNGHCKVNDNAFVFHCFKECR
jgi:hypothetical protein